MQTFEEIVANALTSREEVEMVSNAQIGAEADISAEATLMWVHADVLLMHEQWAQSQRNRPNPFKMH